MWSPASKRFLYRGEFTSPGGGGEGHSIRQDCLPGSILLGHLTRCRHWTFDVVRSVDPVDSFDVVRSVDPVDSFDVVRSVEAGWSLMLPAHFLQLDHVAI